jgi:hypothetical protein
MVNLMQKHSTTVLDKFQKDVGSKVIELGTALSLVAFPSSLRAQDVMNCDTNLAAPAPTTLIASVDSIQATNKPSIAISPEELQQLVSKVVAEEMAKSQTNSNSLARLEQFAGLVAQKITQAQPRFPPHPTNGVPNNAWPLAKVIHKAEGEVTKAIGWNLNTIISGASSTVVLAAGAWLAVMPFLGRYPNEFETKIADLRDIHDPSERFGVEPLYTRTEIDSLLGKPRAMSSRMLSIFLPEKWKLMCAQFVSRWNPEFPFLRFRHDNIYRALNTFLKVHASEKPAIKQSLRDAHNRLVEEIIRRDGDSNINLFDPTYNGEEAITVLTYERWGTLINRALVTPAKDLCALLANPCLFYNQILSNFSDISTPVALKLLDHELTGFMRKIKLAVGIMEGAPYTLRQYLDPHFPQTWNAVKEHYHALRPLLVLNTHDGIAYLTRYMLHLEQNGEKCSLNEKSDLPHSKKDLLLASYSKNAKRGLTREFGVVHAAEEAQLARMLYPNANIGEMLRQASQYVLAAFKWAVSNRAWQELRPAPHQNKPYYWFGSAKMPDPNL